MSKDACHQVCVSIQLHAKKRVVFFHLVADLHTTLTRTHTHSHLHTHRVKKIDKYNKNVLKSWNHSGAKIHQIAIPKFNRFLSAFQISFTCDINVTLLLNLILKRGKLKMTSSKRSVTFGFGKNVYISTWDFQRKPSDCFHMHFHTERKRSLVWEGATVGWRNHDTIGRAWVLSTLVVLVTVCYIWVAIYNPESTLILHWGGNYTWSVSGETILTYE